MLRVAAVLGLVLAASSLSHSHTHQIEWGKEYDIDEATLEKLHGFPEKEIEALSSIEFQQDQDTNETEYEYVSWDEAKGYDECEEFSYWNRMGIKKGDWRKKKDWHKKKDYHSKKGYDKKKWCSWKPKPMSEICGVDIECPIYEKLNVSGCSFEARKVLGAKWTQTEIDISDMHTGYIAAFSRLFNYIKGANDQGAELAMTAPVLETWFLDDDYRVESGYMRFYIPSAFQNNPPSPTDDQVRIVSLEDTVVYDRAFGGHRRDGERYTGKFKTLWKALAKQNITIDPYVTLTAHYTQPGAERQRLEVMFVSDE